MKKCCCKNRKECKPVAERWWPGPVALLLIIVFLLILVFCTGCTLQVSSDGSRTWTANGPEITRALIILSDK